MRYILYTRKSSESEDRQVQSIDDQSRILNALAQQRQLLIVEEIAESKSAKAPGSRPEFDRMIKMIETNKADGILCWHINRLTRNPIESGKLAWMLQTGQLQCIATPERNYLPEDNVLLFSVETGMANQYILDLKKVVKRGMDTKLEQGWFPHRSPEGYINNLREHTIDIDPERFAMMERAWRLLLQGTHTVHQVIKVMNEEWEYRTRRLPKSGGKPLSRSSAYRLFASIFYTGHFIHGGKLYQGKHQPMITMDEFEQVQRTIHRQINKPHYDKHDFAYKGLVKCARCGRTITADRHSGHLKKGNWVYYHCSNLDGRCNKRGIREDRLEQQIDACLRRITIVPAVSEIIQEALEKWITKEFRGQEALYDQLLRSRFDNERLLNELVEMRMRQLIEDDRFRIKKHELENAQNTIITEMSKQEQRMAHTRHIVGNAIEFRLQARQQFICGDRARRREVAKSLGVRYLFDDGLVYIEMNPLLAYMTPESSPDSNEFEPPKMGSGKSKRTDFAMSVPIGCIGGKDFEPMYTWSNLEDIFRLVTYDGLYFPKPSFALPCTLDGESSS